MKGSKQVFGTLYSPIFLKWLVRSLGFILGITGMAKIWSAFGDAKLLSYADPIFGIGFGHLMLAVGVLEILIAFICCFTEKRKIAALLVAWLSASLFAYRVGLWWLHWAKPCKCMGDLTDALHISPDTANQLAKILLTYLIIGSFSLCWLTWPRSQEFFGEKEH